MGQAFDEGGHPLSEAFGQTKQEVFDALIKLHPQAAEIRIKTLQGVIQQERGDVPQPQTQMPRYQSHKKVWALKLADVIDPTEAGNESDGTRILVPVEAGYAAFRVGAEYVRKHNPQAGGYYVVYDDGYASWSPAEAFEEGYTRL